MGIHEFSDEDSSPNLIFRKYIGPPQVFTRNYIEEEWVDYDIEGHFEIIEKLNHNLTRSKLTFTASLDGEVVYEFVEVEMVL